MREFAPQYHVNPSQRTPCMLVLDASGSMDEVVPATGRSRISELNDGLAMLQQELLADDTAAQRVQLAIVCVGGEEGGARLLMDWTDAAQFRAPRLTAGFTTPLAEGMQLALRHIAQQKQTLKRNGIPYTRPWIMVISDGEPTDSDIWPMVAEECRAAGTAKKCIIFPIGVADANLTLMQQLSSVPAVQLKEAKFREYFQWLSSSLSGQSRSKPGDTHVQLDAINPWAMVG